MFKKFKTSLLRVSGVLREGGGSDVIKGQMPSLLDNENFFLMVHLMFLPKILENFREKNIRRGTKAKKFSKLAPPEIIFWVRHWTHVRGEKYFNGLPLGVIFIY
jgi:hypothetical protein